MSKMQVTWIESVLSQTREAIFVVCNLIYSVDYWVDGTAYNNTALLIQEYPSHLYIKKHMASAAPYKNLHCK